MQPAFLDRRSLLAGAAALTAFLPLRQALAQNSDDWLTMVKSQHALIATTLNEAVAAAANPGGDLAATLQKLGFLLTAHSVAEENVLYPALAANGIPIGAAELFLEQDAQKVLNAQINVEMRSGGDANKLLRLVKDLQSIVLEHAKTREEGDLYPKLHARLTASQNAFLSQSYAKFFSMVKQA